MRGEQMNLAQSLGAAAAALVLSLSVNGGAGAQSLAHNAIGVIDRAGVRAAVEQLADRMEASYVFPEVASQYATFLRARAAEGAYDQITDPALLAQTLGADLNGVHRDAHLRVTLASPPRAEGETRVQPPAGEDAFGDERWLADGVAYIRFTVLPEDQASQQRMGQMLDRFAEARVLILDLRRCFGGSTEVMDVLFSRIYGEPIELVTMDTRTGANPELEAEFVGQASMREAAAPRGVTRYVHWALPTTPVNSLADARVYVLTGRTASACEHMSLALKATGRATLVGGTTSGAGHYGDDQVFGDGRFQVFLPVGRTYVAATGQDWEGQGIAPDRAIAPDQALNMVLQELGVAQTTSTPQPDRVEVMPGPRYGLMLQPPRGGEASLTVGGVEPNSIAAQAGVRAGDRILSLNGTAVSQIAPDALGAYMRASPLTLVVDRAGQQVTIEMRRP
jgi:C-terminal processing protease CtpA/Prc